MMLGAVLAGACVQEPTEPEFSALELYVNNCAACHGDQGEGDGPVSAALGVAVPNLRGLANRNGGVFPTESVRAYIDGRTLVVAHGDRYMPVWGNEFLLMEGDAPGAEETVDRKISLLVDFLGQLQY